MVCVVVEGRREDEAHVASVLHWTAGFWFLASAFVLRGQISSKCRLQENIAPSLQVLSGQKSKPLRETSATHKYPKWQSPVEYGIASLNVTVSESK